MDIFELEGISRLDFVVVEVVVVVVEGYDDNFVEIGNFGEEEVCYIL